MVEGVVRGARCVGVGVWRLVDVVVVDCPGWFRIGCFFSEGCFWFGRGRGSCPAGTVLGRL